MSSCQTVIPGRSSCRLNCSIHSRTTRLLEADLQIEAIDNDGILRYEYRWNRLNPGRVFATSAAEPTVSYASVVPETYARLEVRAVDLNGWRSAWHTVWTGVTPSAPMIVLAGDSIASGYTRQWFTGDATCRDADYSFGSTVRDSVAAALPAAWAPDYVNIAFPGAGMSSVIDGGSDSCSDTTSQPDRRHRSLHGPDDLECRGRDGRHQLDELG